MSRIRSHSTAGSVPKRVWLRHQRVTESSISSMKFTEVCQWDPENFHLVRLAHWRHSSAHWKVSWSKNHMTWPAAGVLVSSRHHQEWSVNRCEHSHMLRAMIHSCWHYPGEWRWNMLDYTSTSNADLRTSCILFPAHATSSKPGGLWLVRFSLRQQWTTSQATGGPPGRSQVSTITVGHHSASPHYEPDYVP